MSSFMLVSSFIAKSTSFKFHDGGILTSVLSLDSVCTLRAMQVLVTFVMNMIVVMVNRVLVL